MPQSQVWEAEYQDSKLVTKKAEPQKDTLRFLKFLKKEAKLSLEDLKVLDLGCGTGRNSNYLAELGSSVVGMEISKTAIDLARARACELGVEKRVKYLSADIGSKYPFENDYFDLILDITSSNSLNEKERATYLQEVFRTLKPGGYLFVRALCKEGDKNAKNLLKLNPGKEKDTYVIKEMGLSERVFTEADFRDLYGRYFKIIKLIKKSAYARFEGKNYKRHYWLAYIKKED